VGAGTATSAMRGAWLSAMSAGNFSSALGIVPQRGEQTISPASFSLLAKSRMQLPNRRRNSPVDAAQWLVR